MNPKSPDFKHKVTKEVLWVDCRSTPLWVKAMLKLVTQSNLPSHFGYHNIDSQEILQSNRYFREHELSPFVTRNLGANKFITDETFMLKVEVRAHFVTCFVRCNVKLVIWFGLRTYFVQHSFLCLLRSILYASVVTMH